MRFIVWDEAALASTTPLFVVGPEQRRGHAMAGAVSRSSVREVECTLCLPTNRVQRATDPAGRLT